MEQYAFDEIKGTVARDNLLTYPDFNEKIKIHTNASVFQLGAVISHNGKPIALYSKKITGDQQRYTVTEKELLSIFGILKEFRTILINQKVKNIY